MTADGSNDDLIKLEGFPKGQMYEFMSTEIEEDDGSDPCLCMVRHLFLYVSVVCKPLRSLLQLASKLLCGAR